MGREPVRARLRLAANHAAAILLLALASPAFAQEPPPKVLVSPFGVEIFARLIDQLGMKPVTSLKQFDGEVPISKCVVIVFGSTKPLDDLRLHEPVLRRADNGLGLDYLTNKGAAILIATDRNAVLTRNGGGIEQTVIVRRQVLVNDHPDRTFSSSYTDNDGVIREVNQPACPLVGFEVPPAHPIFAQVEKPVSSNCPAEFFRWPLRLDGLHPVAWLPLGTLPEAKRNDWLARKTARSFALPYVIATPGDSRDRIVILAGHGVFMNCMTIRDDIGNRKFAENILSWLKDGKERTHVLFYHENVLRTNFKLPLVGNSPDMPTPPITMEIVERMLGAIQEDGLAQRLLDRGLPQSVGLRFALIAATIAVFLYGLKKLFGVRLLRPLPGTPYLLGVQPAPHRPLVVQQMAEMGTKRRFDEPARALAAGWFRDVAGLDPKAGGKITYTLRTGLLARRRLSKQLVEMWNLATGTDRGHVDKTRLLAAAEALESLGEALGRGDIGFGGGR